MADAVVLLAGGAASRLPGKLERVVGGKPLILHTFEALHRLGWPTYVAVSRRHSPTMLSALRATPIYDAWPSRGPLWAFLDACTQIEAERVFAVAADLPQIDAAVPQRLAAVWQSGDEAVVPQHAGGVEPLAALYERAALLRAARSLSPRQRAMRDVLAALRVRYEPMDPRYFTNVNTPDDLRRAFASA